MLVIKLDNLVADIQFVERRPGADAEPREGVRRIDDLSCCIKDASLLILELGAILRLYCVQLPIDIQRVEQWLGKKTCKTIQRGLQPLVFDIKKIAAVLKAGKRVVATTVRGNKLMVFPG